MEDLQVQEHLIKIVVHFHVEEEEVNASMLLIFPIILLANPFSSPVILNVLMNPGIGNLTCFLLHC